MDEMTEEQGKAVMDAWGAWMGKVGDGLVDVGSPFGPGASISDDGSTGAAAELSGYSIIEAADLDAAKGMNQRPPVLQRGQRQLQHRSFRIVAGPVLGFSAA